MMEDKIFEQRLDYCRTLVRSTGGQILIVKIFGITNYYYVTDFRPKSLNNAYHEVVNGMNVTKMIENFTTHFAGQLIDESRFEGMKMQMSTESFKFGTDDFWWITSVN
jgi:hypothetical protein